MTRRDQSINARLQEIRDLVRSGATEMTGKTYRDASGKIAGRFGGGFTDMYPELKHAGLSPSQAAAAIERGEGAPYERLRREAGRALGIPETQRRAEAPTVAPHAAISRKCKTCKVPHGKGAHRFHGTGAYHQTHLFSFKMKNPRRKKNFKKRNNPPSQAVRIYGRVLRIEAQKTDAHGGCDKECKQCNHKYVHDFKTKRARMIGLSPGQVFVVPPGKWPLLIID